MNQFKYTNIRSTLIVLILLALPATLFCRETGARHLAKIFDNPERDVWQKPESVIAEMGDLSEKTVADIGAGSGYFTFRLVDHARKVIAMDVDDGFIVILNEKLDKLKKKSEKLASRIEIRKIPESDTGLKEGEVDIILMVDVYHHLPREQGARVRYLKNTRKTLKENGRIFLIDFIEGERPVGPGPGHGIVPGNVILQELKEAGYHVDVKKNILPYQYFFVAYPE